MQTFVDNFCKNNSIMDEIKINLFGFIRKALFVSSRILLIYRAGIYIYARKPEKYLNLRIYYMYMQYSRKKVKSST
jgi:hypothetical protein